MVLEKMKRLLCIVFFLSVVQQLHSQILISILFGDKLNTDKIEFGLAPGWNYAWINNFESQNALGNLFLGLYFDFKLKNSPWHLHTGVYVVSARGLDDLEESDLLKIDEEFVLLPKDGTYKQELRYIDFPLLLKYKFKNHLYTQLGLQGGLLHTAHIEYFSSDDNITEIVEFDTQSLLNGFDYGMKMGLGYKFMEGNGINLGASYYHGFRSVYKANDDHYNG